MSASIFYRLAEAVFKCPIVKKMIMISNKIPKK